VTCSSAGVLCFACFSGGVILKTACPPDISVDNIVSMETRIADSLVARRSPALLASVFSG
jgi:hypothetical protein